MLPCPLSLLPWNPFLRTSKDKDDTLPSSDPVNPEHQQKLQDFTPKATIAAVAFGSSVITTGVIVAYFRLRRIRNANFVSGRDLETKRWIKGIVTSVRDGDNFRLYHTAGIGWKWPLKFRVVPTELKDQTINIRIAGIDAPEAAAFGRPGQNYSEEALQWLKNQVEGKTVWCQLHRRDHYGRIVAVPMVESGTPSRLTSLAFMMLEAGWAVVYTKKDAVYGQWDEEHYLKIEAAAKEAKRGLWEDGESVELPGDYKNRHAGYGKRDPTPRSK